MTQTNFPILIPLSQIDPAALPRDRSTMDDDAMQELITSIARTGLRQPIEVFALADPEPPFLYGLISGLRRLTAHQSLSERRQNGTFTTIEAFVRTPKDIPEALALMISENEVRSDISPWEQGLIITEVVEKHFFDSLDAAVTALHPTANRQKRSRLRLYAEVVHQLYGAFSTPEHLTARQMQRLSTALRDGISDLLHATLDTIRNDSLAVQWEALTPILAEALTMDTTPHPPGRPRRVLHLKQGLTIRREMSGNGWILRFSGPEARSGALIDDVLDQVERLFQPGFGR